MFVTPLPILTDVRPKQLSKAESPMIVTFSPNVTFSMDDKPLNHEPTLEQLMVTEARLVQPEKAKSLILVTLFGMLIDVRLLQPEKA